MNIFYMKIGLISILVLTVVLVIKLIFDKINKKNTEIKFFEEQERSLGKSKAEQFDKVRLFGPEKILLTILKVKNPSKVFVNLIRISIVALALIAFYQFGFLSLYLVFELFMILFTKNKEKEVEDANGLTYIPKTNSFLDMYIPAINNGESVNQIMDRFVDAEKDPDLTKWWLSENRDIEDVPMMWYDVIQIYRNGYYNEQNGYQDSSEIYQKDLIRQQTYYNHFKEKIGEIQPIKSVYYAFMPIILILSWFSDPAFWSGLFGLLDVMFLCLMLFIFSFLISSLHKNTCNKLF